jgi:signal peptidase I
MMEDDDPLDTPSAPEAIAEPDGPPPGRPAQTTDVLPHDERRRQNRRRTGIRSAIEWAVLIGAALLIAIVIKTFLFQAFWIPSESMVPTLREDDRVLVNKLSYRLHDVNRGDIVVFEAPEGANSDIKDLVKRVIGLPGDTISFRNGHVQVNGRRLDEPYLPEGTVTEPKNGVSSIDVPAGSIFVMGDNRGASTDSREFGPVDEDDIVGRVFVRIWPPSRIGFF